MRTVFEYFVSAAKKYVLILPPKDFTSVFRDLLPCTSWLQNSVPIADFIANFIFFSD